MFSFAFCSCLQVLKTVPAGLKVFLLGLATRRILYMVKFAFPEPLIMGPFADFSGSEFKSSFSFRGSLKLLF